MKIQIFGTGCEKCCTLTENVKNAANELGISFELEKVTEIHKITEAGVMMTPAWSVDGKIITSGRVLSVPEAQDYLRKLNNEPNADKADKSHCCCCCSAPAQKSKFKTIITVALLGLVFASVIVMAIREGKNSKSLQNNAASASVVTPAAEGAVNVYYFHGNKRCITCSKIEELTRKAIQDKYSHLLANGTIQFYSINVEMPENEHFIKDFQLASRTVVMQNGDKFEKLDQVWNLVREPEKFAKYIQDGVEGMQND